MPDPTAKDSDLLILIRRVGIWYFQTSPDNPNVHPKLRTEQESFQNNPEQKMILLPWLSDYPRAAYWVLQRYND